MVKFQLLRRRESAAVQSATRRHQLGRSSRLRHRYTYLDPELLRSLLAGLDLMRLFNQLLLAAGGDVEEAMDWMRDLQERGYLPEDLDLEAFFAQLEEAAAGCVATARAGCS